MPLIVTERSRAREIALQVLFEDDPNPGLIPPRPTSSSAAGCARRSWSSSSGPGRRHARNRAELDALIEKTAENWSLGRMAVTDRNVLRMGAYEILFSDTPDPVAINEAVELAKRYGRPSRPNSSTASWTG